MKVEEVMCAFAEGANALERTGRLSSLFDPAAAARCRPSGAAALTARRQPGSACIITLDADLFSECG